MTVATFLARAELRLAQAGYAEAFADAVKGGATNEDALRIAEDARPAIVERVEALFTVLRQIANEMKDE